MKVGKRASAVQQPEQPTEDKGFGQYKIKWNPEQNHFNFDTDDGLHFYGWWRYAKILRTDTIIHCVDIFVKRESEEPDKPNIDIFVKSITYDEDPRNNIRSLNYDICAASNQWFSLQLNGNAATIDSLTRQSKYPTVYVDQISTIDRMIQRLREFRQVAITSGGTRICELKGDRDNPPLLVQINVTPQAIALKGKVPSITGGSLIDQAIHAKRGERIEAEKVMADPENIKVMVAQLKNCKDKAEARKLRAILRSMGHKGGARALGG